jgi:hypothetical protein
MNQMLVIAAIIVALGPLTVGQTKSARRTQNTDHRGGIRRLDQERIQAQIHADAAALDRNEGLISFRKNGAPGAIPTRDLPLRSQCEDVYLRYLRVSQIARSADLH